MRRRQFSAMLATATFSLGGLTGAATGASAQETEPLQVEDVSVEFGGVTTSIGLAELTFEDGTMLFQLSDWTMESTTRSLSIASMRVTVDDVSAEAFSTIRAGVAEAFTSQSLSPLLVSLAEADVNPDAPVEVFAESVEVDGQLIADQITATGTVQSVVPEGTRALLDDGATLEEVAALGTSEWSQLTVQRGDAKFTLTDVVMELDGTTLSITAPEGTAELPGRSLELSDVTLNVRPPESIPQEHVQFASRLRQMGAEGSLSLSELRSAASESGVTAANTSEAVRDARFDLTLGEVTQEGETVVANFETSGTLAELVAVLREQV